MSIADNYTRIKSSIAKIADLSGRDPEGIAIVTVSKTFPSEVVQEAIDSGIKVFGENKIQEAQKKIPELTGDFSFHMIGHLQSNKAKIAVRLFDYIHSIDKIETAEKVNREAEKLGKVQNILIQINSSGEKTKSGVNQETYLDLIKRILEMPNLKLHGLMTMAPFTDNKDVIRSCFKKTYDLMNEANDLLNIQMTELSMGMSSDYEIAVQEGSTMVRVGTAIFGGRHYI